jgi:hypothetical protein
MFHRILSRHPVRNGTLLASFPQDSDQSPFRVYVVDVQTAQLTDPHAGGIQHLEDGDVPYAHRSLLSHTWPFLVEQASRLTHAQGHR